MELKPNHLRLLLSVTGGECGLVLMFSNLKCFVRSKSGTNIDTVASNRGCSRHTKMNDV